MATQSITLVHQLVTVPANTAQVETLTLTGTSGTALITGIGALSKLVTFGVNLATSATTFDTAFSADYTLAGVTVTTSGADIIFTSATPGVALIAPIITNVTGDLAGTVVTTTANSSKEGDLDLSPIISGSVHAEAEIIHVSGVSIQFSNLSSVITSAVGALTSAVGRMTIPINRGVNLQFKGASGGETFIIIARH